MVGLGPPGAPDSDTPPLRRCRPWSCAVRTSTVIKLAPHDVVPTHPELCLRTTNAGRDDSGPGRPTLPARRWCSAARLTDLPSTCPEQVRRSATGATTHQARSVESVVFVAFENDGAERKCDLERLKILGPARVVRVRFPPSAPLRSIIYSHQWCDKSPEFAFRGLGTLSRPVLLLLGTQKRHRSTRPRA
jgi:hypothetical protein